MEITDWATTTTTPNQGMRVHIRYTAVLWSLGQYGLVGYAEFQVKPSLPYQNKTG